MKKAMKKLVVAVLAFTMMAGMFVTAQAAELPVQGLYEQNFDSLYTGIFGGGGWKNRIPVGDDYQMAVCKINGNWDVYSNASEFGNSETGKCLKIAPTGGVELDFELYHGGVSVLEFDIRSKDPLEVATSHVFQLDYRTNAGWEGGLHMNMDNSVTVSGSQKSGNYTMDEWHHVKYVMDVPGNVKAMYFDDEFIYAGTLDSTGTASSVMMVRLTSSDTLCNVYVDNLKINNYAEGTANIAELNVNMPEGDSASVEDMFLTADVCVTNFDAAEKVKFQTSSDNSSWSDIGVAPIVNGVATLTIPQGFVRAQILAGNDYVLATTESVDASALEFTELKKFSMNFSRVTSYDWGSYNYYINANRGGFGTYNPDACQFDFAAVVNTEGVNLNDGIRGECLKLTATSSSEATFHPLGFKEDFLGMTKAAYNAAEGDNYNEKMDAQYVVIQGSFNSPDFNTAKYLFIPHAADVTSANVTWMTECCPVITKNVGEDTTELKIGKDSVIIEKDTWYTVANVIDLKNSTAYMFVDGKYVGKHDFGASYANLLQVRRLTVTLSNVDSTDENSVLYFDDFSVYTVKYPSEIEATDYASDNKVVYSVKNDGTQRNISAITAVYTVEDGVQTLDKAYVTPLSFEAGELYKRASVDIDVTTEGKIVKTLYLKYPSNLTPLCTPHVK